MTPKFLLSHCLILFIVLVSCGRKGNPVAPPPGEDKTPPTVISTFPTDGATALPRNTTISVSFSEVMNKTLAESSLVINGLKWSGEFYWHSEMMTFVPSTSFPVDSLIKVKVTNTAKDLAGNSLSPEKNFSFFTSSIIDTVRPTVLSVAPADGDTNISIRPKITLHFSKLMFPPLTQGAFSLNWSGGKVLGNFQWTGDTVLSFVPANDLENYTIYYIFLDTTAKDRAWNSLGATFSTNFTTERDTIPPQVVNTDPGVGASNISVKQKISVRFSEKMNRSSVENSFSLNPTVSGTFSWSSDSLVVFTPSSLLRFSTLYSVTISTSAMDLAGNHLKQNYVWNFTTGSGAYVTCRQAEAVYLIDLTSKSLVDTISGFSSPKGIAITLDGSYLFVTGGETSGKVYVISTANNLITDSVSVGNNPYDMAISSDGNYGYVSNNLSDDISVLNLSTHSVITTVSVDAGPRGLVVSSDGKNLYVVCQNARKLDVIRTADNTWSTSVPGLAGTPEDVAVSLDSRYVFVTEGTNNTIAVIDTNNYSGVSTFFNVNGATSFDIISSSSYVYFTCFDNGTLEIRNITSPYVWVKSIGVGSGPRGLTLTKDGKHILVANSQDNTLSVIETGNYAVVATIPVGAEPWNVVVTP
ncbi:MAG: Ig-like domain-containing protein [Candidatus Edwardsbacteria bacterium]